MTGNEDTAKKINKFFTSVFTKEGGRQMPETDLNFPGENEGNTKEIRIMPKQVSKGVRRKTNKTIKFSSCHLEIWKRVTRIKKLGRRRKAINCVS